MLQHSYKTILAKKTKEHSTSFYLLGLYRILWTFCKKGKKNRLSLQVLSICCCLCNIGDSYTLNYISHLLNIVLNELPTGHGA